MDRIKTSGLAILIAAVGLCLGCQPPAEPAGSSGSGNPDSNTSFINDGVSAEQILTALRSVYANARTYQDEGTLLLSYRKDGLRVQEPQRFSTTWAKDPATGNQRLASEIFGAQLTADGQRLDCYIFDIETGNLDGQRMVVPYQAGQLPLPATFADPIGRVFLGGFSELPLNETDATLRDRLVPAPIGLLTGQLKCEWLHSPAGIERLPDQTLDGQVCYAIRSLASNMGCDLWINQSTGLLVQMSLPLRLLDPKVMAADAISELQLLAQFKNAALDAPINDQPFTLQPIKDSKPVGAFVALPAALAVESIGQSADGLRLIQPDGKPVDHLHFDGRPTTLLWLGGDNSYPAVNLLTELTKQFPADQCNFGIVYSDAELSATAAQPYRVRPEFTAATASTNVPLFYDPQLNASMTLAVREIPAVVLLDGNSKIQFATSTNLPTWSTDLSAAIRRVAGGDDIATEMLTEYQALMTRYNSQLVKYDARSHLPPALRGKSAAQTDATSSTTALPKRTSAARLRPRRVWRSDDFKQAGNIAVVAGSNPEIIVLDGTRTVVRLSGDGSILSRKQLDLPDGVGVTKLRIGAGGQQRVAFASFGKGVFVFDQDWEPVAEAFAAAGVDAAQVIDVNAADLQQDGTQLVIATKNRGVIATQIDGVSARPTKIMQGMASSIVAVPTGVAAIVNGRLHLGGRPADTDSPKPSDTMRLDRIAYRPAGNARTTGLLLVTALSQAQRWQLLAHASDGSAVKWRAPIGSQFFESFIDPIAIAAPRASSIPNPTEIACAVACNERAIHLFDSDGRWLADVPLGGSPRGVALHNADSETRLLVSLDEAVECWAFE